MASVASGFFDAEQGGYVVRGPRVTDAIGGALMRSYAHAVSLPDDMRRLLEQLDRRTRR